MVLCYNSRIMSKGDKTKKEIAAAFKSLMEKKPFEAITVSEITDACGLNRLTFYYHFQDKYDLLNWIYYNEVMMVFRKDLSFENWADNLKNTFVKLKENENYFINALAFNNIEFQNYMFEASHELFSDMIDNMTRDSGIEAKDKDFISDFFAHGVTGMVIDWTRRGMKESPDEVVSKVKNIVDDTGHFAVIRYVTENMSSGIHEPAADRPHEDGSDVK